MGGKTFHEMLAANPDSFDDFDCRPGPSTLSPEYSKRITPDYIKKAIAERRAKLALKTAPQ